jgi:hypothetical protein
MGRLFWLVAGAAIGGGLMYGAFNYHVLKTDKGFELIPKRTPSLTECYMDVSKFTVTDWGGHPDLSADITAAEKSHLLDDAGASASNAIEGGVQKVFNDIRQ